MNSLQKIVRDARRAVEEENWHAALALGLTLPDMCGKLVRPKKSARDRYVKWLEDETQQENALTGRRGAAQLSAQDLFALRCAFIHAGSDDTETEDNDVLRHFRFCTPPGNENSVHFNQHGDLLQLQIDEVVHAICNMVDHWLCSVEGDEQIQGRLDRMLTIYNGKSVLLAYLGMGAVEPEP